MDNFNLLCTLIWSGEGGRSGSVFCLPKNTKNVSCKRYENATKYSHHSISLLARSLVNALLLKIDEIEEIAEMRWKSVNRQEGV